MRHRHAAALLLLASALLAPNAAQAQDKYDLSDPVPVAGTRTIERLAMNGEDGKFNIGFAGQTIQGTAAIRMASEEVVSIVKVEEGVTTEFRTELLESTEVFEFEILNEKNSEETHSPLVGVPVRWTLIDNTYVPTLVDGEPTEEQLDAMSPRPYTGISEYPQQPVAVGESWTVQGEAFAQLLGGMAAEDEALEGEAKMTLQEIVVIDGQTCAKIAFQMNMASPMSDEDLEGMDTGSITLAVEGHIYRSLKDRIDLKIECEGAFKIAMTGKTEGMEMTTTLDIPITITGSTEIKAD